MEITAHIGPVLAMLAGVVTHIVKKVIERRQKNADFSLREYLLAYPYQTYFVIMSGIGGYLVLMTAGSLTVSSAFLAGVAANSLGDIGPGSR